MHSCKWLQHPSALKIVAWASFVFQAAVALWLQLEFGSFYVATMTPFSRIGVFVMGVAAARFLERQQIMAHGALPAFVAFSVSVRIRDCSLSIVVLDHVVVVVVIVVVVVVVAH